VVVVPVFADQFVNGVRIAGTGAGLVVEADPPSTGGPRRVIAQQDAPRVTEGIETVLADPSYRRQARHIAEEVAAAPTVDAVLDTLLPTEPPGAIP